ncbi:hypothetical protein PTKIN_Ptkin14bG0123100 [Pterospermum kingtungense]
MRGKSILRHAFNFRSISSSRFPLNYNSYSIPRKPFPVYTLQNPTLRRSWQQSLPLITPTRFTSIRCFVHRPQGCTIYPYEAPASAFPAPDYNHWVVYMKKPGGEGAIKQR